MNDSHNRENGATAPGEEDERYVLELSASLLGEEGGNLVSELPLPPLGPFGDMPVSYAIFLLPVDYSAFILEIIKLGISFKTLFGKVRTADNTEAPLIIIFTSKNIAF